MHDRRALDSHDLGAEPHEAVVRDAFVVDAVEDLRVRMRVPDGHRDHRPEVLCASSNRKSIMRESEHNLSNSHHSDDTARGSDMSRLR